MLPCAGHIKLARVNPQKRRAIYERLELLPLALPVVPIEPRFDHERTVAGFAPFETSDDRNRLART